MTNVARNTASVFLNFIDGMGCNEVVSDAIGDFTSRNALKSAMNASDVCGVVHRAVSIIVYNVSGAVHDAVYDYVGSFRMRPSTNS
mmetsp:Transcript_10748/g.31817  ORF Transcript_10748/g.31817 Transcript_10748/m.31817 type:complete len:86 (-) Transcript_10748:69-326(-)